MTNIFGKSMYTKYSVDEIAKNLCSEFKKGLEYIDITDMETDDEEYNLVTVIVKTDANLIDNIKTYLRRFDAEY